METVSSGTIKVLFDPDERETAGLIASACDRSLQLARELWGLDPPVHCHIYVMSSWLEFIFQSAPWPWRVLLAGSFPLWVFRARRTWPYAAAWTQRYGRRVAIGVKPPRLLAQSDRRGGERIFVQEEDSHAQLQQVTCHELVHACSAHLRLPAWLNEGIAIYTTDRFAGRLTVRQETAALLLPPQSAAAPPSYRDLYRMDVVAIANHSARAYWLVRYLEETQPRLLQTVFTQDLRVDSVEQQIAAGLSIRPEDFWIELVARAAAHFQPDVIGSSS